MKIYVLKAKSIIKYFLILVFIIAVISTISITGMNAMGVFTQGRDLPIYSVDTAEKKAALTFDCAWGASDIPCILDTLKKENIKATFFIVGQWAEKYPMAVKAMAEEGHDVANHSYSHLRMGALDSSRVKSEISRCGAKLGEISGKKVDLFRAPYGDYNNSVVGTARSLGYFTIQWSVDSLDWKPGISRKEIMTRISGKIKPGCIVLFHNDTPHTANLLPEIISTVKADGYELVPVSELIMKENYIIDFEGRQRKR